MMELDVIVLVSSFLASFKNCSNSLISFELSLSFLTLALLIFRRLRLPAQVLLPRLPVLVLLPPAAGTGTGTAAAAPTPAGADGTPQE